MSRKNLILGIRSVRHQSPRKVTSMDFPFLLFSECKRLSKRLLTNKQNFIDMF